MMTGASGNMNDAWSAVSSQNGRRYDAPGIRSHSQSPMPSLAPSAVPSGGPVITRAEPTAGSKEAHCTMYLDGNGVTQNKTRALAHHMRAGRFVSSAAMLIRWLS